MLSNNMITINLLSYRYISLTKGYYTIVDKEDYELIKNCSWSFYGNEKRNNIYAATYIKTDNRCTRVLMHNLLCTPPDGLFIDHINGNGLDNRQDNLRIVTNQQNNRSQRKGMSGKIFTSKYKGVCWYRRKGKWVAQIKPEKGYNQICLGYFTIEKDAAKAYNKAATIYFGEYAYLNEIDGD